RPATPIPSSAFIIDMLLVATAADSCIPGPPITTPLDFWRVAGCENTPPTITMVCRTSSKRRASHRYEDSVSNLVLLHGRFPRGLWVADVKNGGRDRVLDRLPVPVRWIA